VELREDPFTGAARVIAPERIKRLGASRSGCPFCPGHESDTPPASHEIRDDAGNWIARAFPNLYPLASVHEVLVPTPRHVTTLRQLHTSEVLTMLHLWQERLAAVTAAEHGYDSWYAHLFVNDGAGAGSSVPHVHAQLMVVPRTTYVRNVLSRVGDPEHCAACSLVSSTPTSRIVWTDERFILAVPEVPRLSGAMVLTPRNHGDAFTADAALAGALQAALSALPDHDFNIILVADVHDPVHWYLELIPRHGQLAGAELGLDITVCIESPVGSAAAARTRLELTGMEAERSHPGDSIQ
jgi:UDPglucose--hexose-1-phosphate uridylyltransferase